MKTLTDADVAAIVKEAIRQNASAGGHERAARLTKKRRVEIAKQAAAARWSKAKSPSGVPR